MAVYNAKDQIVIPEMPKVLENQQINVYVPIVTPDTYGIAKFHNPHFNVDTSGVVSLSDTVVSDIRYSRKTIDGSSDNSSLIIDDEGNFHNILLDTESKLLIPAVNELKGRIDLNDDKIIAINNEIDAIHGEIHIINVELSAQGEALALHHIDIQRNKNDISNLYGIIGSEELSTASKTLKGAINENLNKLRLTDIRVDTNALNIVSINAQLAGLSRTYVIDSFLDFIDFINCQKNLYILEDRDGDGENETYPISIVDLKTGDNILVTETNVPDFWYSHGEVSENYDVYEYQGIEYPLIAKNESEIIIGLLHILETDYTVIEGYAISAALASEESKNAANESLQYREEIKELSESIHIHQIAPPLSVLDESIILTPPTLAQI